MACRSQPSLHNLPLSQIERIEILRGPASSLYGSDAVGGVIQIFTKRGEGPARVNAYAGIGSHDTREAQAGISGSSGALSYSFSASHHTTGGFNVASDPQRFNIVNFSLPNPDDDGYRNTLVTGRVVYAIAKGHEIGATVLEGKSRNWFDRGGPTVDAYNNDKTRAHGAFLRNRVNDVWKSELRWGSSEDWSESFAPGRSLFATTQTQWTWQNDIRLPVGNLMFAFENTEQSVDSTTKYTVKRREVDAAVLGYQGNVGAHSWQAALRRDDNSQFGARRFAPRLARRSRHPASTSSITQASATTPSSRKKPATGKSACTGYKAGSTPARPGSTTASPISSRASRSPTRARRASRAPASLTACFTVPGRLMPAST